MSALIERRSPTIFGDGEQTRDFTYVEDVAGLCLKAAAAGRRRRQNVQRRQRRPLLAESRMGTAAKHRGSLAARAVCSSRAKAMSAILRPTPLPRAAIWATIRNTRSKKGCAGHWRGTRVPLVLEIIRDTIRTIPKGKVATYGDVAKAAGFPGCARQVVWALHESRGLPWHRVLGAGGKILLPGENGDRTAAAAGNRGRGFPRRAGVDGKTST